MKLILVLFPFLLQITTSLKCLVCENDSGCPNYGSTEVDCGGSCAVRHYVIPFQVSETILICTPRYFYYTCENVYIQDGGHITLCYCNTDNCNKDFVPNSAVKIGLNVLLLVLANKLSI